MTPIERAKERVQEIFDCLLNETEHQWREVFKGKFHGWKVCGSLPSCNLHGVVSGNATRGNYDIFITDRSDRRLATVASGTFEDNYACAEAEVNVKGNTVEINEEFKRAWQDRLDADQPTMKRSRPDLVE